MIMHDAMSICDVGPCSVDRIALLSSMQCRHCKYCLQTYSDFAVVFVDSNADLSASIQGAWGWFMSPKLRPQRCDVSESCVSVLGDDRGSSATDKLKVAPTAAWIAT